MTFSRDGNHLVRGNNECGDSLYDCSGNTIENIGQPRLIDTEGIFCGNLSFSPNNSVLTFTFYHFDYDSTICRVYIAESTS